MRRARIPAGPSRPIPCSRSVSPLAQGVGVIPTQLASSRRLRSPRQKISWISRVASFSPIPYSGVSVALLYIACETLPFGTSAIDSFALDCAASSCSALTCAICRSTRGKRSASRRSSCRDNSGNGDPCAALTSANFVSTPLTRGSRSKMPCKSYEAPLGGRRYGVVLSLSTRRPRDVPTCTARIRGAGRAAVIALLAGISRLLMRVY